MRKVKIAGIGMGNPETMTLQARRAVEECDCLIGAARMLDSFPDCAAERFSSYSDAQIAEYLHANTRIQNAVVVVSGDTGFYSAARRLPELLEGFEVEFLPGISSLSYFCAKLKIPWDDVKVVSLHGRDADFLGEIAANHKTFLLTGGRWTPGAVCAALCRAGLSELPVSVGSRLSYADERMITAKAGTFEGEADPLCVMLIENPNPRPTRRFDFGLPDEAFERDEVPMTKSEVRAVSLSKLRLEENSIVYDVGAGTGSVAVEAARLAPGGEVYAVEQKPKACALIEKNRRKFSLSNLSIVEGKAPDALNSLPAPDCVFIGGSSGNLEPILRAVLAKNPAVRVVINAITLETTAEALRCITELKLEPAEIIQLSVAKAREAGPYHLMTGQNPVTILSMGGREANGLCNTDTRPG